MAHNKGRRPSHGIDDDVVWHFSVCLTTGVETPRLADNAIPVTRVMLMARKNKRWAFACMTEIGQDIVARIQAVMPAQRHRDMAGGA